MHENNALNNALGLAMRAGKVVSGSFAVEKALKAGSAKLIVLDKDASENTLKQWTNGCISKKLPLVQMPCMGKAIGKVERMVAAVTDAGFAEMILNKSGVEVRIQDGMSSRAVSSLGGADGCALQSQPQSDERWIDNEEGRND